MDTTWTRLDQNYRKNTMTLLELASQTGIAPKWAATTQEGEYHSACPACGGTDRFILQPNKKMNKCVGCYFCRQCGVYGDAIQFARQFLHLSFQEAALAVEADITKHLPHVFFKVPTYQAQSVILRNPPAAWIIKATEFVDGASQRILKNPVMLTWLASRGLPTAAVQDYKLGWSEKNNFFPRNTWGLSEKLENGKSRRIWIPHGLVIPTIENGKVIRLKVRRSDWHEDDELPKYIATSGSMNGLNIIGSPTNKVIVIVESELDAYAIHHAASDFVFAVAVGSCLKNPDNVTDHLARHASTLLICHDNDAAGIKMLNKWRKLYPHAIEYPTPIGKDIGEAIQKGLNLREWLLKAGKYATKIL